MADTINSEAVDEGDTPKLPLPSEPGDKAANIEDRQANLDQRIEAAEDAETEVSLLKLVVWGTISVLMVSAAMVYLMAWLISAKVNPADWQGNLKGGDWFDIARTTATTLAVLGVGGAAMVAYRRQKTTELTHLLEQKKHYTAIEAQRIAAQQATTAAEQLELDSQKYELDRQRRNSEDQRDLRTRFNTVIEQLANPQPTIQNAGLYAIAALADDWHTYGNTTERQVCIDMFCSHIRDTSRAHTELKTSGDDDSLDPWEAEEHQEMAAQSEGGERKQLWQALTSILDTAGLILSRQLSLRGPWSNPPTRSLNLRGAHLGDAILPQAHLGRANLYGAALYGAVLSGADLSDANLAAADLSGANLKGANLKGAHLRAAILVAARLPGADLSRAALYGANLSDANLKGSNLSGAILKGANLSDADLVGADLSHARLEDANLPRADLNGSDLSGAILKGANLKDADLSGADLSGANLKGADLGGANLSDADLSGANLKDADLSGANLKGAYLGGANLSGVIDFDQPAG